MKFKEIGVTNVSRFFNPLSCRDYAWLQLTAVWKSVQRRSKYLWSISRRPIVDYDIPEAQKKAHAGPPTDTKVCKSRIYCELKFELGILYGKLLPNAHQVAFWGVVIYSMRVLSDSWFESVIYVKECLSHYTIIHRFCKYWHLFQPRVSEISIDFVFFKDSRRMIWNSVSNWFTWAQQLRLHFQKQYLCGG